MINSSLLDVKKNDKYIVLDKNELIKKVRSEKIKFSDKLSLDDKISFGLEIECERVNINKLKKFLEQNNFNWILSEDKSLESGIEITSPVLSDNYSVWYDFSVICDYLKRKRVNVNKNSGGHIHVGAHILSDDINNWINFLIIYSLYEDVIYKFCYGDKSKPRKYIKLYAKPISDILKYKLLNNKIKDMNDLKKILCLLGKHKGVNFTNVMFDDINNDKDKNTLEFRFPNSSSNKITWQNNVNTIAKLIMHSNLDNDQEYLFWLLKKKKEYYDNDYVNLNIEKAICFVDEIFDNNLDKTCFLKQYIK